jgi:hypothetical protein
MKGRVCWSKYMFDKGIAKNVIYSGGAVYSPYCEAEILALYNKAFVPNFKSLPERQNFFKRFKGTQGIEIDTTAYK